MAHDKNQYMREYRRKNLVVLQAKERVYRAAHKAETSASNKKWREANKEYVKESKKQYAEKNKEKIRAHRRQFYLKNREKYIAAARRRYEMYSVEIRKSSKVKHRSDPRVIMLQAAKGRARKKNVTFCLTLSDIVIPKHCPILGIPLLVGNVGRHAGSPSIDRVDPKGPYSATNCRVISFKANTLKNDGTIEDHERIILYMKGLL